MAAGHTADCVTQDSICRKTIGVANSSAQKQVPNAKVMPIGDGRYAMTLKPLQAIVVDFCAPEVALFAANFFASVFFSGFCEFPLDLWSWSFHGLPALKRSTEIVLITSCASSIRDNGKHSDVFVCEFAELKIYDHIQKV